jgi:hypothetical protein
MDVQSRGFAAFLHQSHEKPPHNFKQASSLNPNETANMALLQTMAPAYLTSMKHSPTD